MERVDHVHVVEVGGSGLVSHVDGVLQWQAPYREGLELGIAGVDATFLLIVKLAEAHGHLAAAGTGSRDDDQRPGGLHVVVLAKTLVGVDQRHVVRIAVDEVMVIGFDAEMLQTVVEGRRTALTVKMGDDHAAHQETAFHKLVAQS